jgi:putative addiction module antidote
MAIELKLRKVGNSLGVVLPKEALAHLKVEEGQSVYLTEAPDGSYRVTSGSPEFSRQMAVAEDIARRYRNTLRELAK